MKLLVRQNKHLLWLFSVFLISEWFVNPIGNFPLNDDWTYGKSVMTLNNEGKIDIGDFAAMSLISHLFWGALFTKTFWFSFTILRFSTLISSFIGILFLNKLVLRITDNKNVAFMASLVLLFNPLYFNLSNTFMTDVNFNTLLVLSCYFAYDFFLTQKRYAFIAVFVISLLLVLMRQFGIIVPVCFTVSCLLLKEKRWIYAGVSVILTIGIYAVLRYYEGYLRDHLGPDTSYRFTSDTHIISFVFWDTFLYNFKLRYSQILLHLLVYSFPLIILFFKQIVESFKLILVILVFSLNAVFIYYLFRELPFPIGNVFTNMSLGAETFYETLFPELKSAHEHTFSLDFEKYATLIKYFTSTITLSLISLLIIKGIRQRINPFKMHVSVLFLFLLLFTYIFLMLITESYFDRYHIPIITLTLILICFIKIKSRINYTFSGIVLLFLFYVSVFGTKDYLELNRNRWAAYNYLKETTKINPTKINGGFEVNCWNEGKRSWWYDFFNLDNYDYLIQYRQEAHFEIYKEYEFQRYFPIKKDKIYIFVRQDKN